MTFVYARQVRVVRGDSLRFHNIAGPRSPGDCPSPAPSDSIIMVHVKTGRDAWLTSPNIECRLEPFSLNVYPVNVRVLCSGRCGGAEVCGSNTRTGLGDGPSVEAELVGNSVKKVPQNSEPVGYRRTSDAQNQQAYQNSSFHFRTLTPYRLTNSNLILCQAVGLEKLYVRFKPSLASAVSLLSEPWLEPGAEEQVPHMEEDRTEAEEDRTSGSGEECGKDKRGPHKENTTHPVP